MKFRVFPLVKRLLGTIFSPNMNGSSLVRSYTNHSMQVPERFGKTIRKTIRPYFRTSDRTQSEYFPSARMCVYGNGMVLTRPSPRLSTTCYVAHRGTPCLEHGAEWNRSLHGQRDRKCTSTPVRMRYPDVSGGGLYNEARAVVVSTRGLAKWVCGGGLLPISPVIGNRERRHRRGGRGASSPPVLLWWHRHRHVHIASIDCSQPHLRSVSQEQTIRNCFRVSSFFGVHVESRKAG